MGDFQRGTVVKATFEIRYPDGSRKIAELLEPENVGVIVLDPEKVPESDQGLVNVSDSDWKQNPAMIVYPLIPGGEGGLPVCTHNGCK